MYNSYMDINASSLFYFGHTCFFVFSNAIDNFFTQKLRQAGRSRASNPEMHCMIIKIVRIPEKYG